MTDFVPRKNERMEDFQVALDSNETRIDSYIEEISGYIKSIQERSVQQLSSEWILRFKFKHYFSFLNKDYFNF